MKTYLILIPIIFISLSLTLTSCNSNSCEDSLCLNGGVCIDGSCDCPDKFTGPDCSEQRTPHKLEVRTIKVTRFPGLNGSAEWDLVDGPDLYFRLLEGETILAQPVITVENANHTLEYHFFLDRMYMNNALNEHTLQLRDYDAEDEDDIMGEIKFIPYHTTNGFPSVITWDDGGPIAFTAEIDYIYLSDIR